MGCTLHELLRLAHCSDQPCHILSATVTVNMQSIDSLLFSGFNAKPAT